MAFWKKVLAGWIIFMGVWMMGTNWWERQMGTPGDCKVSYVYDGDTVALKCGLKEHTARVQGLDAPETKDPGCAEEAALGKRATERLRHLIRQGDVTYSALGYDKYGRQLIRLSVRGRDVAGTLVSEGLAERYAGGARINWCAKLRAG